MNAKDQLSRKQFLLALAAAGGAALVGIASPGKTFINTAEIDPLAVLTTPPFDHDQTIQFKQVPFGRLPLTIKTSTTGTGAEELLKLSSADNTLSFTYVMPPTASGSVSTIGRLDTVSTQELLTIYTSVFADLGSPNEIPLFSFDPSGIILLGGPFSLAIGSDDGTIIGGAPGTLKGLENLLFLTSATGRIFIKTPTLDLGNPAVPLVSPAISPASVGPVGGLAGTAPGWNRSDHRHGFSGRFTASAIEFNALLPGGVFPDNVARIKLNTNWTLRRIWAFSKNGPTGGTETYGIVNAAGALQGTAVVLPASAGAKSEAESALQITNLTAGTLYYFAQTASTAVIASTNVEIGIEYTMNA